MPGPYWFWVPAWFSDVAPALRQGDLGWLQQLRQDAAARRPGPFFEIATVPLSNQRFTDTVTRNCLPLPALAVALDGEAAALWLIRAAAEDADAAAARAAAQAGTAAADAAAQAGAAPAAPLDSSTADASGSEEVLDWEGSSAAEAAAYGWLWAKAGVLEPFPAELQDEQEPSEASLPQQPLDTLQGAVTWDGQVRLAGLQAAGGADKGMGHARSCS